MRVVCAFLRELANPCLPAASIKYRVLGDGSNLEVFAYVQRCFLRLFVGVLVCSSDVFKHPPPCRSKCKANKWSFAWLEIFLGYLVQPQPE